MYQWETTGIRKRNAKSIAAISSIETSGKSLPGRKSREDFFLIFLWPILPIQFFWWLMEKRRFSRIILRIPTKLID
jgi:hypothetical protein